MRDPEAEPLLAAEPEEQRFDSWHLALPGGSLAGRGTGGVVLLDAMSATRPLASLLERVPDGWLDRAYAVIARNRGKLGRLVPDGAAPRRYP